MKYQKNRKSTKNKYSPVAATQRGQPEETGDTKRGHYPWKRERRSSSRQGMVIYELQKSCSNRGKREERTEQSSGELGAK